MIDFIFLGIGLVCLVGMFLSIPKPAKNTGEPWPYFLAWGIALALACTVYGFLKLNP